MPKKAAAAGSVALSPWTEEGYRGTETERVWSTEYTEWTEWFWIVNMGGGNRRSGASEAPDRSLATG